MGLSNFPSPAEGVLPILVMNTVMSVAILKNLLRSVLELVGAVNWVSRENQSTVTATTTTAIEDDQLLSQQPNRGKGMRGISITQFKCLCNSNNNSSSCSIKSSNNSSKKDSNFTLEEEFEVEIEGRTTVECCVCLCKFEDEDEVSELSCKHFFHRNCLEKWFDNHHTTCPLCRSIH